MPTNDQDSTPTGENTNQLNSSPNQPIVDRFQNYFKLRGELQEKFQQEFSDHLEQEIPKNRFPAKTLSQLEIEDNLSRQEYIKQQSFQAAFIVAQRVIKAIPQGIINRENLTNSINSAQDEYADNNLWYDTLLSRKARLKISEKIAGGIDLAARQDEFRRIKDLEEPTYSEQALDQLPQNDAVVTSVAQNLQRAGLTPDQSRKIAQNTVNSVGRSSQRHGTELSEPQLTLIFQNQAARTIGRTNNLQNNSQLTNLAVADLKKVSQGLGHGNASKVIFSKGFKLARQFIKTPGLKKFNVAYSVLHPIKTIKSFAVKTGKRVLKSAEKLALKLLFKIAPKLAMRLTQIGEGLSGIGLPLAILQEIFFMGMGKLFGTLKNLAKDFTTAFKEGFSGNLIGGGLKLACALIDTGAAAVGGVVGALGGTAGGAIVGAALGTVVPGLGNVIGAILGGLGGLIAGAGFGANFGYQLRRTVTRLLIAGTVTFYLAKSLLPIIREMALNILRSSFLGTGFTKAVNIVNNAVVSVRTAPSKILLWRANTINLLAGSDNLIGQGIRGVRGLFGDAASQGVRFFNRGTGVMQKAAVETAAKGQDFLLRVTGDAPSALTTYSPVATVGSIVFFAIITYVVFLTAFNSPPTAADTFSTVQSKYISVVKVANPPGPLENTDLDPDLTINYTVTISALLGALTNISFTNDYLIRQEPLIAVEPVVTLPDPPLTIAPGTPFVVTYSIVLNTDFKDSIVCDNFTVTAETIEGIQSSSGVACLVIGDPPDECPFGWPVLPEGVETALNVNQGPFAPPSHAVVNALDVNLSYTNNPHSVKATHSGLAIAGSGGNYGDFIDISSNCGGIMITSRYAHLSARYVNNEQVVMGQEIGLTGKTGTSNHHLHYEFRPPTALPPMAPPFVPKTIPYACYDWGSNPCNVTIP